MKFHLHICFVRRDDGTIKSDVTTLEKGVPLTLDAGEYRPVVDADVEVLAGVSYTDQEQADKNNKKITVIETPAIISTDNVESGKEPVVGDKVYVNDAGEFTSESLNNQEVGVARPAVVSDLYTIKLTK